MTESLFSGEFSYYQEPYIPHLHQCWIEEISAYIYCCRLCESEWTVNEGATSGGITDEWFLCDRCDRYPSIKASA